MPWELAFWTPEDPVDDREPEPIFERLKAGEVVEGLKALPVDDVLAAIAAMYPELETDGGHRLVFKNGSVAISWSDRHLLFASKGNLPQRARHGLTAIVCRTGCWMYEDPAAIYLNTEELAFVVMQSGKHGELPPTVNNLLGEVADVLGGEISLPPVELELVPATEADWEPAGLLAGELDDRSAQAQRCGYSLVGDFLAPDLDVVLRAWYGAPNVFVCWYVQRLVSLGWEEVIVVNADDTLETWSSWAADELTPPWVTTRVERVTLEELHEMMLAERSGKEAENLSAGDFVGTLARFFARQQEWRRSL